MAEVTFCYEVHEDAGLAHDTVTGENAKAYTSVAITLGRELTEEEYVTCHESEVVEILADQIKIKAEHFKPISLKTYLEHTEE